MSSIQADGAVSTVYIRYSSSVYQYRLNITESWTLISSWPLSIQNINGTSPSSNILKVIFTTEIPITDDNQHIICETDGIQIGSESLNEDGSRAIITISNLAGPYGGFVKNGESGANGQNHIYIYNLSVNGTDSSLQDGGGWVCRGYFGKGATNNFVVNCSSSGDLANNSLGSGGIVGAYGGSESGELVIFGSNSSGSIGQLDGGIVGPNAGQNGGSVRCEQCWATGIIGNFGGGIFGDYAGKNGNTEAIKCYTTGAIGNNAGGIYGKYAGDTEGMALATQCYSRGNVGADGGGIFGLGAGTNSGQADARNCYSAGSVPLIRGVYGSGKGGGTAIGCYIASGSWNNVSANSSLSGDPSPIIGTTWVSTGINLPYELSMFGYSPYITTIITATPTLIQTYASTIIAGQQTTPAIINDKSYSILDKQGGVSESYNTITINSTTGVIQTQPTTKPGVYTLYIRNTGSYNITTYTLTVNPEPLCCEIPLKIKGVDNTTRTAILSGNLLIGQRGIQHLPIDYATLVKMRIAAATKR